MSSPREPSMEDILASIKRVIAEEKEIRSGTVAAHPEPADPPYETVVPFGAPSFAPEAEDEHDDDEEEVLELGDEVSYAPLTAAPPAAPATAPAAPAAPTPEPSEPLLAEAVAADSRQRLAALQDLAASPPPKPSTGNPFEDLVRDMMRPMLKAWLDEHLPDIVDAHVRREVSRITGRDL